MLDADVRSPFFHAYLPGLQRYSRVQPAYRAAVVDSARLRPGFRGRRHIQAEADFAVELRDTGYTEGLACLADDFRFHHLFLPARVPLFPADPGPVLHLEHFRPGGGPGIAAQDGQVLKEKRL